MSNEAIDKWMNELRQTMEGHLARYCSYIFTYRHKTYAKLYPDYEGFFLHIRKEELKNYVNFSEFKNLFESMFGEKIEKRVKNMSERVHKHFDKSPNLIPTIFDELIKTYLGIYKKMKEHAQKYLSETLNEPSESKIIESIKNVSDLFSFN